MIATIYCHKNRLSYLFKVLTSISAASKAFSLSSSFWVVVTWKSPSPSSRPSSTTSSPAPPWSCPARPPTALTSSSVRPLPPLPCLTSPESYSFAITILRKTLNQVPLFNLGSLGELFTLVTPVHRSVFLHLKMKSQTMKIQPHPFSKYANSIKNQNVTLVQKYVKPSLLASSS